MRGEYLTLGIDGSAKAELPPRARRIHQVENLLSLGVGTTSACAENTFPTRYVDHDTGNYLRVRGEYPRGCVNTGRVAELPPRARRILPPGCAARYPAGTTSACAENTPTTNRTNIRARNYLRVRGEYTSITASRSSPQELPPRARRIQAFCFLAPSRIGTTSACAENTPKLHHPGLHLWNYLRVRGEYC